MTAIRLLRDIDKARPTDELSSHGAAAPVAVIDKPDRPYSPPQVHLLSMREFYFLISSFAAANRRSRLALP